MKILQQPVFLLLATGTLIGLNFPLGKIATQAGVSPILWALVISLGASCTLLPLMLMKNDRLRLGPVMIRYAVISGLVSFVAANILTFAVIPRVGSGFTGLMFALSPVFTLAISVVFGLKPPKALGIFGIAVGFLGAAVVAWSRQSSGGIEQPLWVVAAIGIPITLAIGNVYRTLAWPEGASPDALAFWSHLISAFVFCLLLLVIYRGIDIASLAQVPVTTVAQFIVGGLTFPVYFRLQQHGGPVLLSQIGYVAAAIGLIAATVFLGETYRALTWTGAAIIAAGIACTILAQREAG